LPGFGARRDRAEASAAEKVKDAAQAAAQSAPSDDGKRDGDEKLTCEQLLAEMGTIQADPALQALMANQVGGASDQAAGLAAAQQMMQQQMANRPSIAKSMAQSLNPFGAKKRAEKQQAETEAQAAEIRKAFGNQPQLADGKGGGPGLAGAGLDANSPQVLRGARLLELSQEKKCDSAAAAQAQPGQAPPPAQPQK
jgi:hypothetical protein